jgi:glycine/D-amino acid oxidase-like deaminating enzyme
MSTTKTDVVIIGGGVMGASIALELSRHGRKVVVVD